MFLNQQFGQNYEIVVIFCCVKKLFVFVSVHGCVGSLILHSVVYFCEIQTVLPNSV